jgi:pyruvate dehydrogenase E1 component alpha subunit
MIDWKLILEKTILIREFEKVIQELYLTDCIQSPVHLSIGQELTAVMMSHFYKTGDHLVGNYRSHALALSISDVFEPIVLELLAKKDGVSSGKAGSMHLSVPNKNLMWTSAIVGTGVPIATGVAESLKRLTTDNVVSVMFGDGAIEEGCVMESLNLASVFKLPIIFILEDNGLAIHTKKNVRSSLEKYIDLANSFNIKSFQTSFKSPIDLYHNFQAAYKFSREERLPTFIEIECYRWIEHVGISYDWNLGYRSDSELESWKHFDIIQSPDIISMDKEFVREKKEYYRLFFKEMFEKCMRYPEPEKEDLLKNVI